VDTLRQQLEIEPPGPEFPRCYAQVRSQLEKVGRKIGDRDTIIAAHALALGAVLVTRNGDEFSRVAGLTVENWQID
jgi:tRNA(fMet)-specific endonuclease VapC